jgi:hypothetical protein
MAVRQPAGPLIVDPDGLKTWLVMRRMLRVVPVRHHTGNEPRDWISWFQAERMRRQYDVLNDAHLAAGHVSRPSFLPDEGYRQMTGLIRWLIANPNRASMGVMAVGPGLINEWFRRPERRLISMSSARRGPQLRTRKVTGVRLRQRRRPSLLVRQVLAVVSSAANGPRENSLGRITATRHTSTLGTTLAAVNRGTSPARASEDLPAPLPPSTSRNAQPFSTASLRRSTALLISRLRVSPVRNAP